MVASASVGNVVAKFFALLVVMVTWAWCMLGECKNFSACFSCRFGLVNSQRLLLECFSSSVPFFSFGFLFSFLFIFSFFFFSLVLFRFGGKNQVVLFSPPIPFTWSSSLPKWLVFGSVLFLCSLVLVSWVELFCGCSPNALWFKSQCSCPSYHPGGQKGSHSWDARAESDHLGTRAQGRWHRQMAGGQNMGGVCGESSPNFWPHWPAPLSPEVVTQLPASKQPCWKEA